MNERIHIERILKELNEILARESKRHEMDTHLSFSMRELIESEIIPQLENELNYEPSDEELGYGSEPPLTSKEMCNASYKQHLAMHS